MPSLAVATAFEARLATWSNIAACPFVDLNEVSDVPSPPFIEIEYPVAEEERESLGSAALFRERGGARFVITVKAFEAGWKAQVLGWAEEIRDLFRAFEFGGGDGEVLDVSPAVLDDANRDGNRYRVPFVATYLYDTIK
jgi:hypothetical protein